MISTSVWRMTGATGSEPGQLEIRSGRLIFKPVAGPGFNVPLAEVTDIKFPWYYFNGGVKFRIGAESFRFSFVEPHNEYADVISGREAGKAWKKAFAKV